VTTEQLRVAIVLGRCQTKGVEFGIRFERVANSWIADWAFLLKPGASKREGYGETRLTGSFEFSNSYPGCPGCSNRSAFLCGCGKLGCWDGLLSTVTCPWCGQTGKLEGQITDLLAGQDR
jgi:hypothetical protein